MKTIKIIIAVDEHEMPILKKFVAEFHLRFTEQTRTLNLDARKFEGINETICSITGFSSPEMVYYFGYQMKFRIDLRG